MTYNWENKITSAVTAIVDLELCCWTMMKGIIFLRHPLDKIIQLDITLSCFIGKQWKHFKKSYQGPTIWLACSEIVIFL